MVIDRMFTGDRSYEAIGPINGIASMIFDVRPWGQKFAYYYGVWEIDFISITRQLYKGGAFIDVGSSLGLYPICVGDLVRSAAATILSVEPIGFNMDKQRRNVTLNGYESIVQYHQVALGAADASIRITTDPLKQDNNAYFAEDGDVEVRVVTLDGLVENANLGYVGFIKMDVEGFEPQVVEGARKTISRDRPIVFAEFNRERMVINGFTMDRSWQFFKDQGYTAHQVINGKLSPLAEHGDVENIFFLP